MKKFVIVLDEKGTVMVTPSKWLNVQSKILRYPPKEISAKRAILALADPDKSWGNINITKIIRYYDDYNDACRDSKLRDVENLSNLSDLEGLRKSRSKRNKKKSDDYLTEGLNPKKQRTQDSDDGTISDISVTENDFELENTTPPLNVFKDNGDSFGNASTSKDSSKSPSDPVNDFVDDVSNATANNENSIDSLDNSQLLMKILGIQEKQLKLSHSNSLKLDKITTQIKKMNQNKILNKTVTLSDKDSQFITAHFPINNDVNDLNKKVDVVEEKLKDQKYFKSLIRYMVSIGGSDANDFIHKIIASTIDDEVLTEYSYYGRKKSENGVKNKAFSKLNFCQCIYNAVSLNYRKVTDEDMKTSISSWLDSCKTRIKRDQSKTSTKRKLFVPLQIDLDDEDEEDVVPE